MDDAIWAEEIAEITESEVEGSNQIGSSNGTNQDLDRFEEDFLNDPFSDKASENGTVALPKHVIDSSEPTSLRLQNEATLPQNELGPLTGPSKHGMQQMTESQYKQQYQSDDGIPQPLLSTGIVSNALPQNNFLSNPQGIANSLEAVQTMLNLPVNMPQGVSANMGDLSSQQVQMNTTAASIPRGKTMQPPILSNPHFSLPMPQVVNSTMGNPSIQQQKHVSGSNSNTNPWNYQGQTINSAAPLNPPAIPPSAGKSIELLDDEQRNTGLKRPRSELQSTEKLPVAPAHASYEARDGYIPDWMKKRSSRQGTSITPGISIPEYRQPSSSQPSIQRQAMMQKKSQQEPYFVTLPPNFVPTWRLLVPPKQIKRREHKKFELSLLNLKEFTITGLPITFEGPPSSIAGLRKKIKEIAREYGNAVYERDKDGGEGRWKIPLEAYRSFYSYLNSEPLYSVVGIPENQLKIASLGKARLEKGYPSVQKIISEGVPRGLATALAPFQRGGVDFVIEKEGRALIADEMGLGKTIQGIASLAAYHKEWPLLVLTPSSARYHWESEFQHWLGIDSIVNKSQQQRVNLGGESDEDESKDEPEDLNYDETNCMPLLDDSQIHVVTSSKDQVIPNPWTRVVICSYGLAPMLVSSGKIVPSMFQCAIADESHMLKNMSTKRTSTLVPILHSTNRCVLLSGTPALARPSELWPQLKILGTERHGWWDDEEEFINSYVKRSSPVRRAELHAMLTGTVMIRRLKNDILKSLPKKGREKAVVDVSTSESRKEFHQCMALLREGKGILGKLARQHSALDPVGRNQIVPMNEVQSSRNNEELKVALMREYKQRHDEGRKRIEHTLMTTENQLNELEKRNLLQELDSKLRGELDVWYRERLHALDNRQPLLRDDPELNRKSVLNKMYTLTAKAKVPLIADMIRRWLNDPTKGKLCVFAHHIFVLDELISMAGLSNAAGSSASFIRIDGSTSPKERQARINLFQTDPAVRIAILGITAAGVAVTLTASATVWFAELFWTPALMIQAEDRCHRIGQNSRVKCLYFVAVGTLDELLWKLLEKKFQDLGEFVEGQEKLKLVVQRCYHGKKELHAIFSNDEAHESEDDDEFEADESDNEGKELLALEHDLERDIVLLGKEELTMIRNEDDDDIGFDGKAGEAVLQADAPEPARGRSEDEAILLSDDEEEEGLAENALTKQGNEGTTAAQNDGVKSSPPNESSEIFDISKPMSNSRVYNLLFNGPSFGMLLLIFNHRLVVGRKVNHEHTKPEVGDVLVAMNGNLFPFVDDLDQVVPFLKSAIQRSSVELTFLEHSGFSKFIKAKIEDENKRQQAAQLARMAERQKRLNKPGEVIDLLDDD